MGKQVLNHRNVMLYSESTALAQRMASVGRNGIGISIAR
jgi:hypothetical protein